MLKCNINKEKKKVWVKANGTSRTLMLEVVCLIRDIYHHINAQAPDAAGQFRNDLLGMLLDPKSPVWKEPDHG